MTEQSPRFEYDDRKISRRALLVGAAGVLMAAKAKDRLSEGISLSPPSLDVRAVSVNRADEGVQLLSEEVSEEGQEKVVTITPEGKLLFEPSGMFFAPGREFNYIHRGGNSFEAIFESFTKGADLFDIDANDVGGRVHGEHGIIPQVKLKLGRRSVALHFPVVFDVDEKEFKLGMPKTYEELIAYIASLSSPERQLAVSTELKRGEFEPDAIDAMLAIHQQYNIPAIMHSPDSERLTSTWHELAALYNLP